MGPTCRSLDSEAAARTANGAAAQLARSIVGGSGGGGGGMGLGGRGVVGERWSQRVLWLCAIGSAVSKHPDLKP